MLDEDGLIKVNGRIDAAFCLPVLACRRVIMPQHHHVTRLIVSYWRKQLLHQNDCLTINEIRQKYWVPHIRSVLASVKKRCVICVAVNAKPATPLMGQLPEDRLTPYARPFTCTGVDYCGTFTVTVGRSHEKLWVALFTHKNCYAKNNCGISTVLANRVCNAASNGSSTAPPIHQLEDAGSG